MDRREFLEKAFGLTVVSAVTPGILTCACDAMAKEFVPLAFSPITVDLTEAKYAALLNIEGSAYVAIPGNTRGIIVNRINEAEFAAMSSVCPHEQTRVGLYNKTTDKMTCTSGHGSTFDIYGKKLTNPAPRSLDRYKIAYDGANTLLIEDTPADVQEEIAAKLAITSLYPNPASDKATLDVSLAEQVTVEIALFDMAGNNQATVFYGSLDIGNHSFTINTSSLASGSYFCKLTTVKGSIARRLQVAR